MNLKQIIEYYSREEVQEALLYTAKNRETVGVYRNGSFGTRPNVILYPQDIIAMVKSGVIEFHTSLERWSNPMALKEGNYDDLRIGWDLILDIDCKVFEHAKATARVLCKALKKHGVSGFSVKYTGGKGFHIAIPWEAMPQSVNMKPTEKLYPELARQVGFYLKEFIKNDLSKELLKIHGPEEMAERAEVPLEKVLTDTGINPFAVIEIDPVLISPRHLFRMPYSINRKTFLVSLPIKPSDISEFEKKMAEPERVKVRLKFPSEPEPEEASSLFAEAVDWWSKRKSKEKMKLEREYKIPKKVPFELFPPCIKIISQGLPDGRKRSVLILINFLLSLKWGWNEIEKFIIEWNEKNKPPLRETYIRGQLRWHKNRNRIILPPNCDNEGYYKNFGVCRPDELCAGIRNPVNYCLKKLPKTKRRRK